MSPRQRSYPGRRHLIAMQHETFLSGSVPIRLDLTEPVGSGPFPAVLLLHGAGGNTGFWLDRLAPFLSRLGIALYAVHYFDRTRTTRATATEILDGHHVPLWLDTVAGALLHIAARSTVDSRRIVLLGISLGAYLALAHATLPDRHRVRAIAEVSGGLAQPYIQRASATFPPTLILHGEQDTVVPVAEALTLNALLTRLDIPHQIQLFPNEGHWFSPGTQLRIFQAIAQFLGDRL